MERGSNGRNSRRDNGLVQGSDEEGKVECCYYRDRSKGAAVDGRRLVAGKGWFRGL